MCEFNFSFKKKGLERETYVLENSTISDQELTGEIVMDSGMLFMFVEIMIVKILEFIKH